MQLTQHPKKTHTVLLTPRPVGRGAYLDCVKAARVYCSLAWFICANACGKTDGFTRQDPAQAPWKIYRAVNNPIRVVGSDEGIGLCWSPRILDKTRLESVYRQ
jgi:hypothetical protein